MIRLVFDRDKRLNRDTRREILRAVRNHFRDQPKLVGFALTTWSSDMYAKSSWATNGTIPGALVPDYVRQNMTRTIHREDIEDVVFGPPPDEPA